MSEVKAALGVVFLAGIIYYICDILVTLAKNRKREKEMTVRIYMVDDAEKIFGKATVYTQRRDGEIAKHVIDVHEDTDVTALAHDMLRHGEF